MKILKLFAFAELPGAVFSSKISLMSITVSISFLLDIKFVSIWNELRKNITEKKIKKLMERLLKTKLPKQLLTVKVIGMAVEN